MMTITDAIRCAGCGACANICPKNAITMVLDEEGFLHPKIDDALCVRCGLCRKVCPVESVGIRSEVNQAYALKHRCPAVRELSTSGGIFIALSDWILSQGGVVYGVIHDEQLRVIHARAEDARQRDLMCGSKYVQSDMGDCYRQARADLNAGRWVLFSGTSCQIDGLNHYLSCTATATEKLLTCGLLCHGVPSPLMWKEHLAHIRTRRKKEILRYAHRPKVKGWHSHNECITYTDGRREYRSKLSQNHKDLFYGHYFLRPSCHQCPYAADPSAADLTIGDFWGCQILMPQLDDNKGVSLVLANTEKGHSFLRNCQDVDLWPVDRLQALSYNHHKPCAPNPQRETFWADYREHGYAYVCAKYVGDSFRGRVIYGIKKRLRDVLVLLKLRSKY